MHTNRFSVLADSDEEDDTNRKKMPVIKKKNIVVLQKPVVKNDSFELHDGLKPLHHVTNLSVQASAFIPKHIAQPQYATTSIPPLLKEKESSGEWRMTGKQTTSYTPRDSFKAYAFSDDTSPQQDSEPTSLNQGLVDPYEGRGGVTPPYYPELDSVYDERERERAEAQAQQTQQTQQTQIQKEVEAPFTLANRIRDALKTELSSNKYIFPNQSPFGKERGTHHSKPKELFGNGRFISSFTPTDWEPSFIQSLQITYDGNHRNVVLYNRIDTTPRMNASMYSASSASLDWRMNDTMVL